MNGKRTRHESARRTTMQMLAAALCASLLASCGDDDRGPARIVLIVIDTLRVDHVSAYGGRASTPAIDRLARRGQRFTRAYASFVQTTMSMASLFTGRTPSIETGNPTRALKWGPATWCGLARYASGDDSACLPAALETLAESLRGAGYWTMGVCSNPYLFDPYGFSAGYDDWVEVGASGDASSIARSVREFRTRQSDSVNRAAFAALARRRSDRFFLYVHYMDVHDYLLSDLTYERAVERVDAAIARLLRRLRQGGLLDDAVVLLTADHGERLSGEKHVVPGLAHHLGNPAFDTVLRVPLIVAPPILPGSEVDTFLRSDDVYRLIRRLAGVPSLGPPDLSPNEHFTSEQLFLTYRNRQWKSYHRRRDGRVFLVDVQTDPHERHDVAAQRPEVVARHRDGVRRLARELRAAPRDSQLTPRDEERLRSLGYLE